ASGQRVAVAAQAGRRETDEMVAGLDPSAGDDLAALDRADREAHQVELTRLHRPRVLRHLAADQRAPGRLTALGHAFDELLDVLGVEATDRDVVEEEQRLGPLRGDVVDAHRDEVDADRREAPRGLGYERLGADAVGRADQHRVAVAILREREEATET